MNPTYVPFSSLTDDQKDQAAKQIVEFSYSLNLHYNAEFESTQQFWKAVRGNYNPNTFFAFKLNPEGKVSVVVH